MSYKRKTNNVTNEIQEGKTNFAAVLQQNLYKKETQLITSF